MLLYEKICPICYEKGWIKKSEAVTGDYLCQNCGTTFTGFEKGFGFSGTHNPATIRDFNRIGEVRRVLGAIMGIVGLYEGVVYHANWGIILAIVGGFFYYHGNKERSSLEREARSIKANYPHWK